MECQQRKVLRKLIEKCLRMRIHDEILHETFVSRDENLSNN